MGAKFAPSVANLFMSRWEEETIWTDRCRYIDDILCIWKGKDKDLNAFLDVLDKNVHGIQFTRTISRKEIHFLDLVLNRKRGHFHISTYFKKK